MDNEMHHGTIRHHSYPKVTIQPALWQILVIYTICHRVTKPPISPSDNETHRGTTIQWRWEEERGERKAKFIFNYWIHFNNNNEFQFLNHQYAWFTHTNDITIWYRGKSTITIRIRSWVLDMYEKYRRSRPLTRECYCRLEDSNGNKVPSFRFYISSIQSQEQIIYLF